MSANAQVAATSPTLLEKFASQFGKFCTTRGKPSYEMKDFMAESHEYPRFFWQDVLLSYHCWHSTRSNGGKKKDMLQKLEEFIKYYPDIFQRELLLDTVQLNNGAQMGDRHDGGLHAAVLWPKTALAELLVHPYSEDNRTLICKMITDSVSVKDYDAFHVTRRARLWRTSQSVQTYGNVADVLDDVAEFIEKHKPELRKRDWTDETKQMLSGFLNDKVRAEAFLAWAAVAEHFHVIDVFFTNDKFKVIREAFSDGNSQDFVKAVKNRDDDESRVADIVQRLAQRNEAAADEKEEFFDRLLNAVPKKLWTPLHLAAANGSNDMVKLFIETCDNSLKELDESEKGKYEKKLTTGFYDAHLMTPLHYAVLGNYHDVVKTLLDWNIFKPHVNACDLFMRTAFQIACSKWEPENIATEQQENIATLLFRCKEVDEDSKDCCSFTALHWAVYSGSEKVAKLLIEREVALCEGGIVSLIKHYQKERDMQIRLLKIPSVKEEIGRLHRDRAVYVDATNAILVGAALIAALPFGGWLQPPVGIDHDEDTAAVHIFWALNNLSFFFAIATVMAGAGSVLPAGYGHMEDAVRAIKNGLIWTSFLLILSVVSVLGAFAAAGFAALYGLRQVRKNMILTTSFGSLVCFIAGLFYFSRLLSVIPDFKEILECIKNTMRKVLRKTNSVFCGEFCRKKEADQPGGALKSVKTMLEKGSVLEKVETVLFSKDDDLTCASRKDLRDMWAAEHQQVCPFRSCYKELQKCCVWDISMLEGMNMGAEQQPGLPGNALTHEVESGKGCLRDTIFEGMNQEFHEYAKMWTAIEHYIKAQERDRAR